MIPVLQQELLVVRTKRLLQRPRSLGLYNILGDRKPFRAQDVQLA